MPDKQDQKKKDGERKDKKEHAMHEHEHNIHVGERHSAHPHTEDTVDAPLETQNSGVGRHKRPVDTKPEEYEAAKEAGKDMRHSHVPHEPTKKS